MQDTIKVSIKGTSPLLMHSFPLNEIQGLEKMKPEEQAEHAAYREADSGQLFLPGLALQRALVAGATFVKGKGRGSLQKQVAACVLVEPEHLLLGTKTYVVDSRAVVVPATRGRIIRHRPRIDSWTAEFELTYDSVLLSEKQLRQIVDDTGSRVGVLDFRPEKKGPFGRFMVTKWDSQ